MKPKKFLIQRFSHQLKCDMGLEGSLKQLIDWQVRNHGISSLQKVLVTQLSYRTKTTPIKYGRRCAALIGTIYDQFEGNDELLDIAIEAIKEAEKILEK